MKGTPVSIFVRYISTLLNSQFIIIWKNLKLLDTGSLYTKYDMEPMHGISLKGYLECYVFHHDS